jgi:hypothetical protein
MRLTTTCRRRAAAQRRAQRQPVHLRKPNTGDARLSPLAQTKNDANVAQFSQQEDRRTWARSGAIARHETHPLAEALGLAEEPVMGRLGMFALGG